MRFMVEGNDIRGWHLSSVKSVLLGEEGVKLDPLIAKGDSRYEQTLSNDFTGFNLKIRFCEDFNGLVFNCGRG